MHITQGIHVQAGRVEGTAGWAHTVPIWLESAAGMNVWDGGAQSMVMNTPRRMGDLLERQAVALPLSAMH